MPWLTNYDIPCKDPGPNGPGPLRLASSEDLNIVSNLVHHMKERCRESLSADRILRVTIFFSMKGTVRMIGYLEITEHPDDPRAVLVSEHGIVDPYSKIVKMSYHQYEDSWGRDVIHIDATLDAERYVVEPSPIPLVFGFSDGSGHIIGKRWYDRNRHWADGPCFEDPNDPDEKDVYNYSNEIAEVMDAIGYFEENGEYYGIGTEKDIREIQETFREKGFVLLYESGIAGDDKAFPIDEFKAERKAYERSLPEFSRKDGKWRLSMPESATCRQLIEAVQECLSKKGTGEHFLDAVIAIRAEGLKQKLAVVKVSKGWYGDALKTYAYGRVPDDAEILSASVTANNPDRPWIYVLLEPSAAQGVEEPSPVPLAFVLDQQDDKLLIAVTGKTYREAMLKKDPEKDLPEMARDQDSLCSRLPAPYNYHDEIGKLMEAGGASLYGDWYRLEDTCHLERILHAFLDQGYAMEYIPRRPGSGPE